MDVNVSTRTSSYFADRLIQGRDDNEFLTRYIPNAEQREQILTVLRDREKNCSIVRRIQ